MIPRFIILAVLGYFLYRILKGVFGSREELKRGGNGEVIDEMVQDPVCKTYIPRRESIKRIVEGQEHFFCSKECADKFKSES